MAKKQILCPNCGAQLKKSQLIEMTCPYCGSKIKNPLNKLKGGGEIIGSIVPFNVSKTHVMEAIFSEFINKNKIPQDIFDKLEIVSIEQYYLPMRRFCGSFEADWSCTVVYRTYSQGNSYEERRPASGTARGNFAKMVLAHNGQDMPNGIQNFVNVISITSELHDSIKKIEQSYLQDENGSDIRVIQSNLTIDDCWNDKSLEKEIVNVAHDAARSQTSSWDTRDFRSSERWRYNYTDLILMPIWYLRYKYDGQEYYFIMDGQDGHFYYTWPEDDTSGSRLLKLFLRLSLMVAILVIFLVSIKDAISKSIEPISVFASTGGFILIGLFILEYSESSKELSSIKKIGLAKFRNETPPDISVNYVRFKRINQILMWVLIGVVAVWSCIAYKEQTKYYEQKLLQAQQKHEQAQQKHEQAQQKHEQAQAEISKITPDLFFYQSKGEIGHLKQDIRNRLNELGFVKEESKSKISNGKEKYTLYSNENPLVRVLINFEYNPLYQNYFDKINCIKISVVDDRLASSFVEEFKSKLKSMGYKFELYSPSYISPYGPDKSYMLIEETHEEDDMGIIRHYVKYNAVVFEGNDINCYAHDEIEYNT